MTAASRPQKRQHWDVAFARASVATRGEWLLRKLAPAYKRAPGVSAVVGRGCFDDLDTTFADMPAGDQRAAFDDLACEALRIDRDAPETAPPMPSAAAIGGHAKRQRWDTAFAQAPAAVRLEWLGRQLRPACERSPGASAVVGPGRFDLIDSAWVHMTGEDKLAVLCGIARDALGVSDAAMRRAAPRLLPKSKSIAVAETAITTAVAEFRRQRLRLKFGSNIQSSALHFEYLRWAEAHGHFAISNKRLSQELSRLGLTQSKSSGIFWLGVEIVADAAAAGGGSGGEYA